MEPIRPDDDELRADPVRTGTPPDASRQSPRQPVKKSAASATPIDRRSGSTSRLTGLLVILLLVITAAGAIFWYQQSQQIEAMKAQLEEADYWARQSKLALARFQGDLSATGENLAERGSGLEQQLNEQKKAIADADSEIRKLWVIANEKNRPALEAQGKRLDELADTTSSQGKDLKTLQGEGAESQKQINRLNEQLDSLNAQVASLDQKTESLVKTVATLTDEVGSVDDKIAQRLQRFQREQSLASDGLESRVSKLEDSIGVARKTDARLDRMENTLNAVDAARGQLTSRLIQLSRQVDALQKP